MITATEASAIRGLFKNQLMNYLNNRIKVLEKSHDDVAQRLKELYRTKTFVKEL